MYPIYEEVKIEPQWAISLKFSPCKISGKDFPLGPELSLVATK